jgi:murein DD-endopeptidase MepM/ murein hydrolase activator NlpD
MSTDNIAPIQSATTTETERTSNENSTRKAQQRAQLAAMAAEFESMLLVNMLRDMRTSGRWSMGGESGGERLGADTFDSTFDLELSRYLAKARGLGLSQQLLRALDGAVADSRSSALGDAVNIPATTGTTASPTTASTSTTGTTTAASRGRTGWNGMLLDPPAPGNSGAQWGGFNVDRALAGGDENSIKDGFYRWTYGLSFNPAGKSKEEIGEFMRQNVASAREYGVNILDVRGDQILVETAESGPEWVDIVAGAGSTTHGDVRWQWIAQADYGVETGGGALGQALASLRGMPGGSELARSVLADGRLVGDALTTRLQTVAADVRAGRTPSVTTTPTTAIAAETLRAPTATVTSAFGWRQDPIDGTTRFHRGVDLRAAMGDEVSSTGAGHVVFSGIDGGYGTTVVVEHANGLSTRYAHLLSALVNLGDEVEDGQAIGLAGRSGRATGPHVHYEVMASGRPVDPLR